MKKYQIVYKDLEKAIHCQKYKVWLKRFMEQVLKLLVKNKWTSLYLT